MIKLFLTLILISITSVANATFLKETIITDQHNHKADVTVIDELRVTSSVKLAGSTFASSVDPYFWTVSNSGTGSGSTINNISTVTSGTSNSGYGQIISAQPGRFVTGTPNLYRGIHRVTATTATNNTRRWGVATLSSQTPQNGFYFELSGAGVLSVVSCNAASCTSVSSGSFNGNVTSYTMDTNIHSYEIIYFVSEASFYIDNVLIHKILPTTTPMSGTNNLYAFSTSINSASGTVSGVTENYLMAIKRLGELENGGITSNIKGNAATWTLKLGAGKLHKLIFNNTSGTSLAIYDSTTASGTLMGTITTTASLIGSHQWDAPFFNGLTIVTTGNGLDLTVVYE